MKGLFKLEETVDNWDRTWYEVKKWESFSWKNVPALPKRTQDKELAQRIYDELSGAPKEKDVEYAPRFQIKIRRSNGGVAVFEFGKVKVKK